MDVRDYKSLEQWIGSAPIDHVFHHAAEPIVSFAMESPWEVFEINVRGTWNLLEACRKAGNVRSIVTTTSDKAYGIHTDLPYTEATELRGGFPYDASKASADLIAQSYARSFGLPVNIIRWGNIFGGGDLHFSRLIPRLMQCFVSGEPVELRDDGKQVRSYLHVADAIEGYLSLSRQAAERGFRGEAFNMAGETPLTSLEVFKTVARLSRGACPPIKLLKGSKGEIPMQYLSIKKAREMLGWSPKMNFESGLLEAMAWYTEFFLETQSVELRIDNPI